MSSWSRMTILHGYCMISSSGQEWEFHIPTAHLVVKNGNFTFLLHILVVNKWDISHCYWHSSGQEWQFHIATDIQWSRMAIFSLELTSSGQEWQVQIATNI